MSHDLFGTRIIAAPMAGGTSTPAFVRAVSDARGLGFLAAGYKSVEAMAAEIRGVRASGARFGVNVFVPDPAQLPPPAATVARLETYRRQLSRDALRLQVDVPPLRLDDDDQWSGKMTALLADPVELVSFTFGLPGADGVRALQRAGSVVLATVTTVAEALAAAGQGVDALVVQHDSAGGHSAAFLPATTGHGSSSGSGHGPGHEGSRPLSTAELVAAVRSAVGLPLVAAGGVMDRAGVEEVLAAGAQAAQLGTAFLRTSESGARQLHKDALASPRFTRTALTPAFTGRQARALVNEFVRDHPDAPESYPAVHHLTAPLRAAAAAAGDAERLNLWAGTGWQRARAGSVAEVLAELLD
ncbi:MULTISPECIES: nitronate monooxygenase [unclassified Arthrobacter]|uniref:nitronate monooxygenase n=1 Tax=unclassified Arthrobacter TaxID=235627 RepID=UPI002E098B39|nr:MULTISPECIES: nitronate monooxygenase [unclassified Arthrobacter]MEC5192585.1 nitronate monooxygenase [Arthrobacter sp. MP_M4]MEC5204069.1 nitronate monooxygenase [Arthrobacter sp. MP_M7]